jgi:hypothetical protein
MILTEKEAMDKTCCGPPVLHNEFVHDLKCVTFRCMAWRWVESTCDASGEGWKGYCGLAGRPEPIEKEGG